MGIYAIETPKFRKQVFGSLGTDAAHTGNIVRGIPHQGFQIDQLFRLEAVFFPENFLRIERRRGLTRLRDHQLHMDVLVDEL